MEWRFAARLAGPGLWPGPRRQTRTMRGVRPGPPTWPGDHHRARFVAATSSRRAASGTLRRGPAEAGAGVAVRGSPGAQDHRARHRKTCGSLLAAIEVHPRVAMQILRHSKIAVTMEMYTEVPSATTREALKKLGRWLDV